MKLIKKVFFIGIILVGFVQLNFAIKQIKIFNNKKFIKIRAFHGDFLIKKSKDNKIKVFVEHDMNTNNFRTIFRESKNKLILKEKIRGRVFGCATWILEVPENIDLSFNSVTGNLVVEEMNGNLTAQIISGKSIINNFSGKIKIEIQLGDIIIKNSKGTINAETGLGEVTVSYVQGKLNILTYKGDLKAEGIELCGFSKFTSYYGNCDVILAKSAEFPLSATSGLGDVKLSFNKNPIKGSFELTRLASFGTIQSKVRFDHIEEIEDKDGLKFIKKSFCKDVKSPRITLKAHRGNIILK